MSYIFWLCLGIVLAVSEFAVPGFVIIFFGAGAIVTGVLKLIFSGMSDGLAVLIFLLASIGSLLLFRKTWCGGKVLRDGNTKASGDVDESCVGRKVVVVEAISPDKAGKVELNGVDWTAESDAVLPAGANAVVVYRQGLTLTVKSL